MVYKTRQRGRILLLPPFHLYDKIDKQDADDARVISSISTPYPKEQEAIEKYGEVMYFWPQEVLVEVYGDDYSIPTEEEYNRALSYAENAIMDKFGEDTLSLLGNYRVGVMLRSFDDLAEAGRVQLSWDFMFSTDPVYLSDGYRVQFVQFLYSNGREEIDELSVEPANMGNS